MSNIQIRPASITDSESIREWRNDPGTREMSRDSKPVERSVHDAWLADKLAADEALLLICLNSTNGAKVGIVRFDLQEAGKQAEISINLAPEARGQRLATPCLTAALNYLSHSNNQCQTILAEIKTSNPGSRRAFEAAGFTQQSETNMFWQYRYQRA